MPKFISTVRFVTKDGCADEFIRKHHETDFKNIAVSQQLIRTSDKGICWIGVFESKESLVAARPELINQLDQVRHLLEEISPELGVTNPVSGPVVWEI